MTNTTNTESDVTPLKDPETADLRERCKIAQQDLSLRKLADAVGVSHQRLSRWLAGERGEEQAELHEAIKSWLATVEPRSAAERHPFVETVTSERVLSALAYAQAYGDLIAIYGGPGVGKTRTLHHYRAFYPGRVWLATMTPAVSAVVPALEELAEAVGVHDATGGARRLSRAIRAKVRGCSGLVVIDEAQHLSMSAIEELRSIHDATECGLALVGNEVSYARFTGGSRSAHFAQLSSRLGLKLYLKRPESHDVRVIATHWKATAPKVVELLERVASRPGALRGVIKVLRLATSAGGVDYDSVRAAVNNLGIEV